MKYFVTVIFALIGAGIFGLKGKFSDVQYTLEAGILPTVVAKELCTCLNVMDYYPNVNDPNERADLCLMRNKLPVPRQVYHALFDIKARAEGQVVDLVVRDFVETIADLSAKQVVVRHVGVRKGCRIIHRGNYVPPKEVLK